MKEVIKLKGKVVEAYKLGENSKEEERLLLSGKIKKINDDEYEVFSQEARGEKGEKVKKRRLFYD